MGNANSVTQTLYNKYIKPNIDQQTTETKKPATDAVYEKYIKKAAAGSFEGRSECR